MQHFVDIKVQFKVTLLFLKYHIAGPSSTLRLATELLQTYEEKMFDAQSIRIPETLSKSAPKHLLSENQTNK